MSLLLDQNISFRVFKFLEKLDFDVVHVSQVGLNNTTDYEIWNFAKTKNLIIVSYDNDFLDLSLFRGFPPKVIIIKSGNLTKEKFIKLFKAQQQKIEAFIKQNDFGCLEVFYND